MYPFVKSGSLASISVNLGSLSLRALGAMPIPEDVEIDGIVRSRDVCSGARLGRIGSHR